MREPVARAQNATSATRFHVVAGLSDEEWQRPLHRPEGKDPWTVKDALVHITHWKANVARVARKQHCPPEERGLETNDPNHLIRERWHEQAPQEVRAWHGTSRRIC